MCMDDDEIVNLVDEFNNGMNGFHFNTSFDYCYNYFKQFYEDDNIEGIIEDEDITRRSCLEIGFFMASWGMYRSGEIKEKSVKIYEPMLTNLVELDDAIWDVDVNEYNEENINLILDCRDIIANSFYGINPTHTFISKIMLGIFGCIPAFDTYLAKTSAHYDLRIGSICRPALENIHGVYLRHQPVIDELRYDNHTLNYDGGHVHRLYPRAKIIDMVLFQKGKNL